MEYIRINKTGTKKKVHIRFWKKHIENGNVTEISEKEFLAKESKVKPETKELKKNPETKELKTKTVITKKG